MPAYTKEQFSKLYDKLPQDLQNAMFSNEIANDIGEICQRNEIVGKQVSEIAAYVGTVLLGLLAPEDFPKTIEKELRLKKEVAKKVANEVSRFIFFPVKDSLATMYNMKFSFETTPSRMTSKVQIIDASADQNEPIHTGPETRQPSPESPGSSDTYREPIEQ